MRESHFNWGLIGKILMFAFVLLIIGLPLIELARPGAVMCPLRRMAYRINPKICDSPHLTDLPPPLTQGESEEAEIISETWKEAALQRHPELRIEKHPVPAEENGYLQLCLLDSAITSPSELLRSIINGDTQSNTDTQRQALTENKDWIEHLEWIASLPSASSEDLPGHPTATAIHAPLYRQADATLRLMATLAAKDKDEALAMKHVDAWHQINRHLHAIERPTFATEKLRLETELGIGLTVVHEILPALGHTADLEQWALRLDRMGVDPARYAAVFRGDWHDNYGPIATQALAYHWQRRLIDPEAAMEAFTELRIQKIQRCKKSATLNQLDSGFTLKLTNRISPEADAFWRKYGDNYGGDSRLEIIHVTNRYLVCQKAAIGLLLLESRNGSLQGSDSDKVIHDPVSGKPFLFDPEKRTLSMPTTSYFMRDIAFRLPW